MQTNGTFWVWATIAVLVALACFTALRGPRAQSPRAPRIAERVLAAFSSEIPAPATPAGQADPLALLKQEFPDLAERVIGRSVLDFGCGDGHQAAALARMGATVTGLDTHRPALDAARRAYPQLRFVEATDEHFDVVVSQNAMEHFRDPEAALRSMLSHLRPGGSLLLTFGPPWYAPYGAHMRFFCRLPWIQLVFSERTIMAVRARYRDDGATRFEDAEQGLNRMSVARFERMLSGLRVVRRQHRCVRGLSFLARIPLLRELFINQVTVVIEPVVQPQLEEGSRSPDHRAPANSRVAEFAART